MNEIAIFKGNEVRKTMHDGEWWFSVVDVCAVLTESKDAGAYWRKLKQRLTKDEFEVVTICHGLKLTAPDGKQRTTDCANTEGVFRIIQSIPSPKAEPFKRWLAKVAREGGEVAGNARKELEKHSGRKVVSAINYKELPESEARKLLQ